MAVKAGAGARESLKDKSAVSIEPGVYFRVELAGITGHKQLATDSGILVKPSQVRRGRRGDAARLHRKRRSHRPQKSPAKISQSTNGASRNSSPKRKRNSRFRWSNFHWTNACVAPPSLKHGHIGVYRQKEKGKSYVGVVVPVGVMTSKQMRRLAEMATNYASGQLRLTPWQNLLLPDVPDAFVETMKRQLVRIGFHHEATNIAGGLVACTGNTGCKWAASRTPRARRSRIAAYLSKRVQLDQPINIHLTGCPNSCAQHYIGDIGLQGVKVNAGGSSVEGYNIVFGGGYGADAAIGKEVFKGISLRRNSLIAGARLENLSRAPPARRILRRVYARRHEVKQLQEMFSS